MRKIAVFTLLLLLCASNARADLKTLLELGKNQDRIAKALKQETKNYNKVKGAIEKGGLKEGETADKIREKYGEPVIDVFDKKRNTVKWLYMPETSTHFEGEKLYLFMDKDDKLVGWQLIEESSE